MSAAAAGELIDWHSHIWRPEHLGPVWGPLLDRFCSPLVPSAESDYDHHGENMREAGATKFVVVGLTIHQIGMCVPNDYLAEYVDAHRGRALGIASVDPTRPGAVKELKRAIRDLGLHGLKLSPPYQGYHPHCDEVWEVYKAAADLGIFVMFHQGGVFVQQGMHEYASPVLLDKVARSFPDMKIVVAHMGKPWVAETVDLMMKNPNVYADLSAMANRPWQLYNGLRLAVEYHQTSRLLFGSDFPVLRTKASHDGIKALGTMDLPFPIPPEVIDDILYQRPLEMLLP